MNLFQLKSKPHGIERLPLFLEDNFIAIGWPGIDDLTNVSAEEIEKRLEKAYPDYRGQTMAYHKGMVNAFVNTMEEGDLVMIGQGDYTHFGQVGPYKYIAQFDNDDDGMCHQRNVKWLAMVEKNSLNDKVQEHLRNRATITKFKYPFQLAEIETILAGEHDSTIQSSEKALVIEKAWNVLKDALESDDAQIRVLAAAAIIQNK